MTRPRVADRRSSGAVVVLFITGGGSDLQTGHGCVMQRLLEEWIRYTQRQWVMIKIAEPLGRGI